MLPPDQFARLRALLMAARPVDFPQALRPILFLVNRRGFAIDEAVEAVQRTNPELFLPPEPLPEPERKAFRREASRGEPLRSPKRIFREG